MAARPNRIDAAGRRAFKVPGRDADHGTMAAPGGTMRVARTLGLSVLTLALLIGLLPAPVTAAPARYAGGDAGSGLPPVPLQRETSAARRVAVEWSDVTDRHAWAREAIDHVAGSRDWMRDYAPKPDGTVPFKPSRLEPRRLFARAMVRAFAPDAMPDPGVLFTDLDPSSKFWRFASVAVSKGWMTRSPDGSFRPDDAVTTTQVHRALVLAVGLRPAAKALNAIRYADGSRVPVPGHFGTTVMGMRLNLRYPSKYEDNDVLPTTPLSRSQVAYSLWKASVQTDSTIRYLLDQHRSVVLPNMGPARRQIVEWGVRYVGYPYVWAGEWGLDSPAPSALGGQSIPGFDCSGLAWWVMRRNDSYAWQVAPPRPYRGWSLPERSSATMAGATTSKVRYADLKPGDLMFYASGSAVDHVDVYVGNGWALDSSTSVAGVTLMWVGDDSWYQRSFVHGRRLLAN